MKNNNGLRELSLAEVYAVSGGVSASISLQDILSVNGGELASVSLEDKSKSFLDKFTVTQNILNACILKLN